MSRKSKDVFLKVNEPYGQIETTILSSSIAGIYGIKVAACSLEASEKTWAVKVITSWGDHCKYKMVTTEKEVEIELRKLKKLIRKL